MFGCGRGQVPKRVAAKLHRIAKKHGGHFVDVDMPTGSQYWFSIPNCGAPFDKNTADEILGEARAAGIWPVGGR